MDVTSDTTLGQRGPGSAFMASSVVLLALAIPASIVIGRAALGVCLALGLASACVAYVRQRQLPSIPFDRRAALVGLALALAWVPSIVESLKPLSSLLTVGQVAAVVAMGLLAAAVFKEDAGQLAPRVLLAGLVAALVVACLELTVAPWLLSFRTHGVGDPALTLKAAASAISCTFPLVIFYGWPLGGRWRAAVVAIIVLGLAMMALTHSRSSVAGLAAALLIVGVMVGTHRLAVVWRLLAAVVVLAAVGALGAWCLSFTEHRLWGGYPRFAPLWMVDAHRQVIWQFSADLFFQHPWAGWGIGVISSAPGASNLIAEMTGAEFLPSHTHNWVIQIFSEAGLVGGMPFVLAVLSVLVLVGRRWYLCRETAVLTVLSLWVVYWSAGLFNFSLWNTWWQSHLVLLLALMAGQVSRERT